MIKKTCILIALLLSILVSSIATVGCAYITGEALTIPPAIIAEVKNITPEQANTLSQISAYRVYFIDVRTPAEFAEGHVGGAVNIDYNSPDFKNAISGFARDDVYIVYCLGGGRSAAASQHMVEHGFLHIDNMTGGYKAWVAAGLPVEK